MLGCGSDATELRVDLRSDYVPGGDFVVVEVSLEGREGEAQRTSMDFETDVFEGVRVARFDVANGTHRVHTRLLDAAGAEVDARLTVVEVRGSTGVTVLMDRSCQSLQCEACVAGRCIDPTCSPEMPDRCEAECMADADCPAPSACGSAACVEGVCLARRDDSRCAADEWCSPESGCVSRSVATQAPTFPLNGALWNQYVTATGAPWESPDEACVPTADRFDACLHGGEHRTVTVDGLASCDGVEVSDSLGAFEWRCVERDGVVRIHSTRLNSFARLGGLLDVNALRFRPNWVEVSTASRRWSTAPAIWWRNPVRMLAETEGPVNATSFDVLVVPGGSSSSGLRVRGTSVALVVDGTLRATPGGTEDCLDGTARCLVEVTGDFHWVEGVFDADGVDRMASALAFRDARFVRARHVRVRNTWGDPGGVPPDGGALHLRRVRASRIHEVVSHESGHTGVRIEEGIGNELASARVSRSAVYGIMLADSVGNVIRDTHVNGAKHESYWLAGGARDNTIVYGRASGGEQGRHVLFGESRNTMHRVLATNLRGDAFHVTGTGNTLSQIVAFDVSQDGLQINDPGTQVVHYACLHCRDAGLVLFGVNAEVIAHGSWFLGASAQPCVIAESSATPGIDATCAPQDESTATIRLGVAATDDYGRRVPSDSTNMAAVSTAFEDLEPDHWSEFDAPERGWALDLAPGDPSDQRRCEGTEVCRMWEWTLGASTVLRDAIGSFATCDAGPVVTDRQEPPNTYLSSAEEIAYDFIGDDDGLCEAGEHCVLTPHLGPQRVKPGDAFCESAEGAFLHEPLGG